VSGAPPDDRILFIEAALLADMRGFAFRRNFRRHTLPKITRGVAGGCARPRRSDRIENHQPPRSRKRSGWKLMVETPYFDLRRGGARVRACLGSWREGRGRVTGPPHFRHVRLHGVARHHGGRTSTCGIRSAIFRRGGRDGRSRLAGIPTCGLFGWRHQTSCPSVTTPSSFHRAWKLHFDDIQHFADQRLLSGLGSTSRRQPRLALRGRSTPSSSGASTRHPAPACATSSRRARPRQAHTRRRDVFDDAATGQGLPEFFFLARPQLAGAGCGRARSGELTGLHAWRS